MFNTMKPLACTPLSRPLAISDFCRRLPKTEFHAHLGGSMRDSTVISLAAKQGHDSNSELVQKIMKHDRDLKTVFDLFRLTGPLIADLDVLGLVTEEMIEDYANEGCRYLEIRTSLKALRKSSNSQSLQAQEDLCSREDYLLAVLKHMNATVERIGTIEVRVLISINRGTMDATEAEECVDLALKYRLDGVRGIDLSGDPRLGDFSTFIPALTRAKQEGLLIALHFGEVPNRDAEQEKMIAIGPDRLGHAVHVDSDIWDRIAQLKIPVEVCLTSNLLTNSVPALEQHHLNSLLQHNLPLAICADDRGIFDTTLSREYSLAAAVGQLSEQRMFDLSASALRLAPTELQPKLFECWQEFARASGLRVDACA